MRTEILSTILGSEGRKRVLQALLDHPDKDWTVPDLEEATGVPHATVWRTISQLEEARIVRSGLLGRKTRVYRLVTDSPYLPAIKSGLGVETVPLREVAAKFARGISGLKGVRSCTLYGSVARGTASPKSDIDVLVLVDEPMRELKARITKAAVDLSHSTGCSIVPTILSAGEFEEMLKADHEFALAVKKDGTPL
jgi:predicted nucleotidyltransferase